MDFIEGIDTIMSESRVEDRKKTEYPVLLEDLKDMIEMEKCAIEELETNGLGGYDGIGLQSRMLNAGKLSLEMMYDYAFLRFGVNLKLTEQNQE